jgi:hypothetical protein
MKEAIRLDYWPNEVAFLSQFFEENPLDQVASNTIYDQYKAWADGKVYVISPKSFFKIVVRVFPAARRIQAGSRGARFCAYRGITPKTKPKA